MCRSKAEGGRRCPGGSHRAPGGHAARPDDAHAMAAREFVARDAAARHHFKYLEDMADRYRWRVGRGKESGYSSAAEVAEAEAGLAELAARPRDRDPKTVEYAARIPPMPADYVPVRTTDHTRSFPDLSESDRRMFWLRDHGYEGPIDENGNPRGAFQ